MMQARGMFVTAVLAALAVGAVAAQAQTATVTVTYQVTGIQRISVSSPTTTLTINGSTGSNIGVQLDSAFTTGLTYNITNNMTPSKITGVLGTALPAGVDMDINLGPPSGATSAGKIQLSTTAADLVTGIGKLVQTGMSLYIQMDATVAAGVIASASEVITLTLTGGA